jgi:hypothetical protein
VRWLGSPDTGDRVIVSVHWGPNWGCRIAPAQRGFARGLIDAGAADLVDGHSSHHPLGMERHRERLILFGSTSRKCQVQTWSRSRVDSAHHQPPIRTYVWFRRSLSATSQAAGQDDENDHGRLHGSAGVGLRDYVESVSEPRADPEPSGERSDRRVLLAGRKLAFPVRGPGHRVGVSPLDRDSGAVAPQGKGLSGGGSLDDGAAPGQHIFGDQPTQPMIIGSTGPGLPLYPLAGQPVAPSRDLSHVREEGQLRLVVDR